MEIVADESLSEVPVSDLADVFVLAAGKGERLRPLTETTPKPLIAIGKKCPLERVLEKIAASGFPRVIVNVHHLPEQIISFLDSGGKWGLEISISQEDVLLDTGGGIRKIQPLLKCPRLITVNSDILFGDDFSFKTLLSQHLCHKPEPLATLVLRPYVEGKGYGKVGVDASGRIVEILSARVPSQINCQLPVKHFMYTGIQVVSQAVFDRMPPIGSLFSITRDTYVEAITSGEFISSFIYEGPWTDIGTPEELAKAKLEWATEK